MPFLKSLRLSGLLSFPADSPPLPLSALNVLIGPNASGKSNLLEAIELLHAAPRAFADAIRDGGGASEWLWKGEKPVKTAAIETVVHPTTSTPELKYRLCFTASGQRTEVTDEALENTQNKDPAKADAFFYYRFQGGRPVINVREIVQGDSGEHWTERQLERQSLVPDESVLSQRKDPDLYPELTWLGQQLVRIQMFREWSVGRSAALRQPQPADLATDLLLPDSRNLGLILNEIEHNDSSTEFNRLLTRFLPRFKRFSTRIQGGTVQFYLHEDGLKAPVPATRLSDGTLRFMAMLALLLTPSPPPLACIEEPEIGLHPDAVTMFAELLVEASNRTQLIVTTHADELVSALSDHVDSVLVCEHRGGTVFERLDPDKLAHWLDKYRLGEIWRIGELGGNP